MITYEWCAELMDGEDIVDHRHAEKLSDIWPIEDNECLVLIRNAGNDVEGITDRTWAYALDGMLPNYFSRGGYDDQTKVPHDFTRDSKNPMRMTHISDVISYTSQHPIVNIEGSKWLVVGTTAHDGQLFYVDIFYNDDLTQFMLSVEDFEPLPDAAKLCAAYNKIYDRDFRLMRQRATTYHAGIYNVLDAHYEASEWLAVARKHRASPKEHACHDNKTKGFFPYETMQKL